MADVNGNVNGVFGNVQYNESNGTAYNVFGEFKTPDVNNGEVNTNSGWNVNADNFKPIEPEKSVAKQGVWAKIRAFLFQEIDLTAPIKVELTPYQQKIEDEINEFLHQEITFKSITNIFKKSK